MATDYEAAFESVMKYMRAPVDEVDSQEKLARYLRQNDLRNTMAPKFIDKITETQGAREVIDENRGSRPKEQSRAERSARSQRNDAQVKRQNQAVISKGKTPKGTFTDKKGNRHAVVENSRGQRVAVFEKSDGKIFGREVGTGRFASIK